LKYFVEWSST